MEGTNMFKAIILTILLGFTANAQTAAEKTNTTAVKVSKPAEAKKTSRNANARGVEKIEVTGSYIRRIDTEGPTPLVTIDKKAIDNTGDTTIEDVLRESTYFESVYGGGKQSYYEGHIRFHGQHAGNTLILLNGLRLPKEAGGFYTSVSYFPTSAIDHIEMLKDGGSALYGSDAMAGVINFITRKDFNGTGFSTKFGVSQDGLGQEQSHSLSYGKVYNKGSYLLTAQYRRLEPYNENQLGTHLNDGGKNSSVVGPYGTFSAKNGKQSFGPPCAAGSNCKVDPSYYDYIQNATEDMSTLMTGQYDFNSTTNLSLLEIYNHKTELKIKSPLTYDGDVPAEAIMDYKAASELKLSNNSAPVHMKLKSPDLGPYTEQRVSDTINSQFKLRKEFGETWSWQWSSGYTHQNVNRRTLAGDGYKTTINNLIATKAVDPTSPGADYGPAVANPLRTNVGQDFNSKLVTSGELFDFGEGAVSMAVGTEFDYETFAFSNDESVTNDELLSYRADNFSGFRRVNSAFVEFSATPLNSIEAQLAARFDHYNDVGDTFNPKVALSYKPLQSVLLRASFGTGFKPPGVSDMFTPAFSRTDRFDDIVGGSGKPTTREVTVIRNQDITFETSTQYNIGTVIQPNKNLTLTLDQWNFLGKGTISNFTAQNAMNFYERFGLEGMKQVRNIGLEMEVDPKTHEITRLQVPNVFNRSEKILRGIDFSVEGKGHAHVVGRSLAYGVGDQISHIFERKERTFDFSDLETKKDYGTKNTISAHVSANSNYLQLSARTLLNGDRESVRAGYGFPVYTEYDATYAYSHRKYGKLSLTVKNLLDSRPQLDTHSREVPLGSVTNVFSALGRRFVLGYSIDI